MNKFLAAVILGSILLVGVGYGSISLMQKTNAQQGQNMTGNATMTGGNVTGNATSNMTSGSGSSITIVPGSSAPANGKSFDPASTTVSAGTTVTWTNDDTTLHTVTSGSAESGDSGAQFDSSYLAAGKTYQHKFDTAGTFDYYCTLHPFMKGKVIVS
jgi:nitrite reductase (NO-forming)